MKTMRVILIMFFMALIVVCSLSGETEEQSDPLKILFPFQWVGNIDKARFNEPSGLA